MTDSLRYYPEPVTDIPDIERELWRLSAVLNLVFDGYLPVTYVEPEKPRDGMTRLADGTKWNPGTGQGVYTYYNSTWNRLG